MKSTGLWNKALFIVVADHGGDISPAGSRRPVTKSNFAAVAGVPMFVKLPGQSKGCVDETFTTTMDVVPTVAKQLGVKTDWKFDGIPVDEPHPDTAPAPAQRPHGEARRRLARTSWPSARAISRASCSCSPPADGHLEGRSAR